MAKQYDAMVKPRRFNIRDLVLKRVSLATRNPAYGKLGKAGIILLGSPRWMEARAPLEC